MKKKFDRATHERVLAARQEGKTLKKISSETGVCLTVVKKWLKEAAAKNDEGIQIRRYYTQAERKKILAEYSENHSTKAICAKYKIAKSTLIRWQAQSAVIRHHPAATDRSVSRQGGMRAFSFAMQLKNNHIFAAFISSMRRRLRLYSDLMVAQ